MDATNRSEEASTSGTEEVESRPTEAKTESLLLEIENRNNVRLKALVRQGADVKLTGNFSLSKHQKFADVPPLFAAILSDQLKIVDFLVGEYPHFLLKEKASNFERDEIIVPQDADPVHQIEVLELVGAACVFHGYHAVRNHGWASWKAAMNLREANGMPKTSFPHSELEKIVFRRTECMSSNDLRRLRRQNRMDWMCEAFIISQRILKKHGRFPSKYLIFNLYRSTLRNWESRGFSRYRVVATCLYVFEIVTASNFLEQLVLHPLESNNVLLLTFIEFSSALKNSMTNQIDSTRIDALLTFANMMNAMTLACKYQFHVTDFEKLSKKEKIASELILVLLKKMISFQKSETQSWLLKSTLQHYVLYCERGKGIRVPNLLVKICASSQGRKNDFEMIQMLLEVHSDSTIDDEHGHSPLHLLSEKELQQSAKWDRRFYQTRASKFSQIVGGMLNGRHVEHHAELYGGVEPLRYLRYHPFFLYPCSELHEFLHDMFDPGY